MPQRQALLEVEGAAPGPASANTAVAPAEVRELAGVGPAAAWLSVWSAAGAPAWRWSSPDGAVEWLAAGAALTLELGPESGWQALPTVCSHLAELLGGPGREGFPQVWLGGRHAPASGGAWEGWPGLAAVAPRAVVRLEDGRATLLVQGGGDPDPVERQVRAALSRSGPLAEPRQAATVSEETRPEWEARVEAARAAIEQGALEKVVLARAERLTLEPGWAWDPDASWEALRRSQPGCWTFAWSRPGAGCFLGASPELLARRQGLAVESAPLAGTAPRHADPEQDRRLGQALLASKKDDHEHRLTADAVRRALGELCQELAPEAPPRLRLLPSLQHLETCVRGTLAPGVGLPEVAARLHPTPAVGGWPREAAARWQAAHEPLTRGWFGAPLGWLDGAGDGELVVAIRSALLRGRQAWCFAGAGVVADSDPAAEWDETALKLGPARRALRARPEEAR